MNTPLLTMVKDIKKGTLVRIGKSVYVRDSNVPSERKYSLYRYDDINRERLVRGSHIVEHGFTF